MATGLRPRGFGSWEGWWSEKGRGIGEIGLGVNMLWGLPGGSRSFVFMVENEA